MLDRENAPTKWAGRNRPWPFRVIVASADVDGGGDGYKLPTLEIYDAYRE